MILAGTSGWSYAHWRNVFYPEGLKPPEFLGYYREHFRTPAIKNAIRLREIMSQRGLEAA